MAPIVTVGGERSFDFAPIGLANMLNGGGAVVSARVVTAAEQPGRRPQGSGVATSGAEGDTGSSGGGAEAGGTGSPQPDAAAAGVGAGGQLQVIMAVKGRGSLVCYCTRLPHSCNVDGFEVPFRLLGEKLTVEVPQVSSVHAGCSVQQLEINF